MDLSARAERVFFRLRVGVAALSWGGFWVCQARVGEVGGRGERAGQELRGAGRMAEGPAVVPRAEVVEPVEAREEAVVMIDPGHGGLDGGTVGNGLVEKDWTLKVGLALAAELRRRGHRVALTREDDATLALADRPAVVNAAPRVALLSIHFNAGAADAVGVETWYSWPKKPEIMARLHDAAGLPVAGTGPDDGQRLAQAVQAAVQQQTGARDRGIKNREDLAMTSRIVCPAVLIECGFLSSAAESRKIGEAGYRKKLVRGIADGYEEWLGGRAGVPMGAGLPVRGPTAGEAAGDAAH